MALLVALLTRVAGERDGTRRPLQPLLVVLDLDETLVHATLCPGPRPGSARQPALRGFDRGAFEADAPPWLSWLPASRLYQEQVDFAVEGRGLVLGLFEEIPLFISVRPGAADLLRWLKAQPDIEVAVYTAGTEQLATQTLSRLGLDGVLALYRQECVPFGLPVTKDLTKLRQDMSRVVLVDNQKRSFWLQPQNGILVADWLGSEPGDTELWRVRSELERLAEIEDVRQVLPRNSAPPAAAEVLTVAPLVCWRSYGVVVSSSDGYCAGEVVISWHLVMVIWSA
eukprot:CAMPEP_0177417748 /NCGR_PEP_ID=MMETSP0368-20130122/68825_1 /TAXON_ID=447022 ORGANISM="Scrippsiella hangoei-like, Strain SHHI-4" /NCGR_SAMPLE_ID=MMETSP0368 /ASSEMBLY_ACC=CAM_ASM_000363 /LENGTH=282 /DNA_ID=CAMNT_0018887369 /DNA_START=72 /DNA_END=916 /DNA_ORIENTATION=+